MTRGLEIFEKVKDEANTALLYANTGHLHRMLAHTNTPADRGELTQQEKLHYNKAFINYKKALQVLGERHHCPGVWDAVKWELSTALFTMGTIIHENPPSHLVRCPILFPVSFLTHFKIKRFICLHDYLKGEQLEIIGF